MAAEALVVTTVARSYGELPSPDLECLSQKLEDLRHQSVLDQPLDLLREVVPLAPISV